MNTPTAEPNAPKNTPLHRHGRAARAIHHVIEHDRRSWDRLLRQMLAQDRCLIKAIGGLFRRPAGKGGN